MAGRSKIGEIASSLSFAGDRQAQLEAENARLRAALAEQEARLERLQASLLPDAQVRLVADALPVLISYVDADQRYRYNNKAYEAWFGLRRKQLLGRRLASLLDEGAYAALAPLVEQALAGIPVSAELRLAYGQNGVRDVLVEYVPDRSRAGGVRGFFSLVQDITERKRVETALRDSEARFRAMADCVPSPVWVTNADGIDFVNRAFVEHVGLAAEALGGEAWMEIIHPDDLAAVLDHRCRAWKARRPYGYEARFRRADGRWRWMRVSCNPRLDAAGELMGYVGLAVDLTEQKQAEEELRESEARFRAMADSAPAPIWVTDVEGIAFANRALCEFSGLAVKALVGQAWIERTHPDDLEEVKRRRDEGWAARAPYSFEARFRRHDGEWRWLRGTCKPREGHDGFVGYVGLAVDVTESRRAEEELRASEAVLRAIFDNAGIGMVLMDSDCRIIEANPAYCAILGRSLNELVGRSCLEFTHPDDAAADLAALDAFRHGASAYAFEKRSRARGRGYIHVRLTLSRIGDRILAIVEDVTARKEAEHRLRELNQSLEARVAAAVAERHQAEEALRQAQKMEAVGQLTGGIAHDFNNLLTVIGGNVDMVARRLGPDADPRVLRAIESARTGAERAATLTQRLLAFSRRQPLAPKAIDPNALLAGMSDLLLRTIGETILVETRLSVGLWRIEADPHQLESAILNLAVNARDAMPEGGRLTIETAAVRIGPGEVATLDAIAPGPYVMISVADTGTGMDEETLRRAIEPFFTTKDVGKGTGLGLSMVYGFVRQSGGHLRIDSREGHGTRVHILLPKLEAGEQEEEKAQAGGAPRAGGDETILVCEDDEDVRAYTREILKELGYRVLEAPDGPSTLGLLKDPGTRVDLLFTDVVLPGMSGAELARRAREARPRLKVLFTTGYARDAIVHEGRLDSGVELVPKPFDYAVLANRLREVLDRG